MSTKPCADCQQDFVAREAHHTRCRLCQQKWFEQTYDRRKKCLGCNGGPVRKDCDFCAICSDLPEHECSFCQQAYRSESELILCQRCTEIADRNLAVSCRRTGRLLCAGSNAVTVRYRVISDGDDVPVKFVTLERNIKAGFRPDHFDDDGCLKDMSHPSVKYYLDNYHNVCVFPFSAYGDKIDPDMYLVPVSVQLVPRSD